MEELAARLPRVLIHLVRRYLSLLPVDLRHDILRLPETHDVDDPQRDVRTWSEDTDEVLDSWRNWHQKLEQEANRLSWVPIDRLKDRADLRVAQAQWALLTEPEEHPWVPRDPDHMDQYRRMLMILHYGPSCACLALPENRPHNSNPLVRVVHRCHDYAP